ncbi:MAG: DNA-processing protein DprA [Marinobacter sp.]|uniref:DNA-processing protein DprA n=1 Tax=Marinobacter sp. TaxID=50741 RepID=UPI0029C59E15|nr:DNA-processing protein DprA [Marinobacter sp.]MDX5337333.1 DNA-processing protein DprA [Marinobacter sp.]MDX5388649.1 DNA-processing protein DprA [Marinobacter sp.]MDX5439781.1 DNA-processing protein DprA [Alteromonadaceae bacterium]MDX5473847.1 DNA-processing protein DprA [Marinobacter sp.]
MSAPTCLESASDRWLLLSLLPRFGLRLRERIDANTEQLTDILDMNAATLKVLGLTTDAIEAVMAWQADDSGHPVIAEAGRIRSASMASGIFLMGYGEAGYPDALRHIHNAPLLLYGRGDPDLLHKDQLGVVGSRNATRAGLEHARQFAAELSRRGLLITSGLALGIDGAAHAGALDAGFQTIAVVGCGLDRLYPAQHRKLAGRIIEQGLIVSEYPPGTQARAAHFPQRNRIISGLSRGVLVVEASLRSGSLITARTALEQGREVFAIPGSVHSPVARGCHQLIKQGARLVETADDVLEELGTWWSMQPASECDQTGPAEQDLSGLDSREIAVLEALGYDPQSTDALSQATGLPADQLMQSLLLLELEGLANSAPGGYLRAG